jgi:hypothetical protein
MQPIEEKEKLTTHKKICYDNEGILDCVCILQHEQNERS